MKVKNLNTLWGINTTKLIKYGRKYNIISKLLYIVDIVVVVLLVIQMYNRNVSFEGYMILMLLVCGLFALVYSLCINAIQWGTYKFFKRHLRDSVHVKTVKLTTETLYSILYLCKCKRLKQDKDFEIYKEQLLSACCEDASYAFKVMKYINKYETDCDGDVKIYYASRGNKQYFLDFIQEEEN